jgi:hypothetical protein
MTSHSTVPFDDAIASVWVFAANATMDEAFVPVGSVPA